MKGLLGLSRQATPANDGKDNRDTFFFSTAFADLHGWLASCRAECGQ